MSEELAKLLTALLIDHVNKNAEDVYTDDAETERLKKMFLNGNFVSITYWIGGRLRKE